MPKMKLPKAKAKSMNMMGKSVEPWMKKAKKPEADAKPKAPGARSVNKNVPSARVKKLAGITI